MIAHRIVAYLISLAVGYWVLTLADKQKNLVKTVGMVIGWVIIVVSAFGPLCVMGSAMHCRSNPAACTYSSECPWNGHSMMGGSDMMKGKGMMGDEDKDKSK